MANAKRRAKPRRTSDGRPSGVGAKAAGKAAGKAASRSPSSPGAATKLEGGLKVAGGGRAHRPAKAGPTTAEVNPKGAASSTGQGPSSTARTVTHPPKPEVRAAAAVAGERGSTGHKAPPRAVVPPARKPERNGQGASGSLTRGVDGASPAAGSQVSGGSGSRPPPAASRGASGAEAAPPVGLPVPIASFTI